MSLRITIIWKSWIILNIQGVTFGFMILKKSCRLVTFSPHQSPFINSLPYNSGLFTN